MEKKGLLALLGGVCLVLILAALPFMAACAKPAPAPAPAPAPSPAPAPAPAPAPEAIELKAVTFLPDFIEGVDAFLMLRDIVNERANGELIINYLGNGEVIGEFEQAPAVVGGVVDIAWLPSAFYAGLAPGLKGLAYSQYTAWEERETGAHDFINELHMNAGLFYLGHGVPHEDPFFYIFLNPQVETPYDLAGLKISDGMTDSFLRALGSVPVEVEFGEVYTAMERGTIDGWTFQFPGVVGFGWHEVTKYWIDHPFYMQDIVTIINLDKWNSLPKHLQDVMIDAQLQIERDYPSIWAQHEANERQTLIEGGVEPIKFSPADAQWYVDTSRLSGWEKEIEKHPDVSPKLKELLTK